METPFNPMVKYLGNTDRDTFKHNHQEEDSFNVS